MVCKSTTRRSVLLGLLLVTLTMGAGLVNAISISEKPMEKNGSVVQTNGDDVSFVFRADTSNTTLETWVEENNNQAQTSSQESSSQVIQYQNVSQLNVNQQGVTVAIAVVDSDGHGDPGKLPGKFQRSDRRGQRG